MNYEELRSKTNLPKDTSKAKHKRANDCARECYFVRLCVYADCGELKKDKHGKTYKAFRVGYILIK
jgi:hypothetical protein